MNKGFKKYMALTLVSAFMLSTVAWGKKGYTQESKEPAKKESNV